MLRNYIIIALRNIRRSKVYSFINILGLSLGVACCLLLALYVQDEYSYDKHHNRLDDLYRITTKFESDRGLDRIASISPPIAMTLRDEIPEIESAARVLNPPGVDRNLIKYEDNLFYETEGFIADSTLFDVLTYTFLEGNSKKALVEANSIVISDKLAVKLFGNDPALDKIISLSHGAPAANYKITGVFKDDTKSHLHANFFTSMTSSGWGEYLRTNPRAANEWAGQNFVPAYVKLVPGHDMNEVIKKMNEVLVKHGTESMKALGLYKTLSLEPVKDIYLKTDIGRSPRIIYTYVIVSIAVFILLIACINFMNLSTAKASKRATEIGIRKVMGAFRSSLIQQILGEALVIVLISLLLSVMIVQMGLPYFNELTGKSISFGENNIRYFIFALTVIAIVTGIVAGSYPAFYLSSFQPAQVLKGKFVMSNASGWLRRSLVVFQFMIAITLVCGMLIISRQISFMQNESLGFNAEAKIVIPLRTSDAEAQYETLKKELQRHSDIQAISATSYVPGTTIFSDLAFYKDGGTMDNAVLHKLNTVDAGYIELLDIKLLAGRSFSNNLVMEQEGRKIIVNKLSAEKMGFTPQEMIGQHLHFDIQGQFMVFEVIGVMDDFHQNSLKEEINPVGFVIAGEGDTYTYLIASVQTGHFEETVASIERTWKTIIQDTPFEYSFLDDTIQKQYDEDRRVSSIINIFTVIAMFISCLGLYGLSMYMAERRFKEIGIRKVMGASVSQIVSLMSTEFVKLIVVAFVLAVPLAWYGMNQWLEGFAYRAPVNGLIFVYAGLAALTVALLTVSFESMKAATADPVKSLKDE